MSACVATAGYTVEGTADKHTATEDFESVPGMAIPGLVEHRHKLVARDNSAAKQVAEFAQPAGFVPFEVGPAEPAGPGVDEHLAPASAESALPEPVASVAEHAAIALDSPEPGPVVMHEPSGVELAAGKPAAADWSAAVAEISVLGSSVVPDSTVEFVEQTFVLVGSCLAAVDTEIAVIDLDALPVGPAFVAAANSAAVAVEKSACVLVDSSAATEPDARVEKLASAPGFGSTVVYVPTVFAPAADTDVTDVREGIAALANIVDTEIEADTESSGPAFGTEPVIVDAGLAAAAAAVVAAAFAVADIEKEIEFALAGTERTDMVKTVGTGYIADGAEDLKPMERQ
ncbi:hypothetical protein BDV18DRAFT_164478 [Aspergillus unguis]